MPSARDEERGTSGGRGGREVRAAAVRQATGREYDLIVIGGGINGAGIARDAALRGLTVLLLERHDYGCGTTWRSTKLIHGGLRYLEHREFRLVYEGLRERATLLRTAPHLVRPLQFVLPVFRGGRYGPGMIRVGLALYDLLSHGKQLPNHRTLSPDGVAALEPAINRGALRGGFTYYDAQVELPERLCVENVLSAEAAGARAFNHVAVTHICTAGGRVTGVAACDAETGAAAEFRGRVVVNASGPWVDMVLGGAGAGRRYLDVTRGSHIVVDFAGAGPRHAIYSEAGADGRPFFIVPWRGRHLIGTTDTRYDGDPGAVMPDLADIDYLRRETARVLPGLPLPDAAVLYAFAGLRPLARGESTRERAITRRHFIHRHDDQGYAGLLSIVGGKLTSYRALAREVVDDVCRQLGRPPGPSTTASAPLVPGPPPPDDGPLTRHLAGVYGPRAGLVLALARVDPALAAPLCPHGPDIAAQAVHAVRHEGARTVGDVLLRRTPAGWNACRGVDAAPAVARLVAGELGWSEAECDAALTAYGAEVNRTLLPGAGALM